MATRSNKTPPRELDEGDRLRISHARAVLQEYGLYVDVAELSDVAYEQRNCRMKSLDLAVSLVNAARAADVKLQGTPTSIASDYYAYLWEGKLP